MTVETVAQVDLDDNGFSLWLMIGENLDRADQIYVTDEAGEIFTRARLERRQLSDGSYVHNLVLTRSA